ncbi:MAG TPA: GyrI-like domain-containing protein [Candidatus Kapabacteria bacterium]|nr:GyrI-like domain-containing protein [Candidatus Kapabacteria bacterium]
MKKIIFISLVFFVFTGLIVFAGEAVQTPMVKEVEGGWYAYMEFTGPYNDMQNQINKFIAEFFGQGLTPAGPSLSLYFNSPAEVKPEELRWAFGFIVSPEIAPKEPIKKMELKKQQAVVYLHKGPYTNLAKSYEIAWKFLTDNGYRVAGPMAEKYLNNPMEVTPENLQTEIIIPVTKK